MIRVVPTDLHDFRTTNFPEKRLIAAYEGTLLLLEPPPVTNITLPPRTSADIMRGHSSSQHPKTIRYIRFSDFWPSRLSLRKEFVPGIKQIAHLDGIGRLIVFHQRAPVRGANHTQTGVVRAEWGLLLVLRDHTEPSLLRERNYHECFMNN